MKDSPARIASHFCAQVLKGQPSDGFPSLVQYFEDGGSVCALARKGVVGLVDEYGLALDDARALALRLNGLATWVLRRYIEDQLTHPEPLPAHLRHGMLALVTGPTYGDLFEPNFGGRCPADAIEAIHSPVAYAVWLKRWSEQRLRPSEPADAFLLKLRRVDLDKLDIDPVTTYGVVSSVEVVSRVLEKSIEDSLGEMENLDAKLNERSYPNGLPYHHPWATMDELTRDLGTSIGGIVKLCDPKFPYFLRDLPWGETADDALIQATRLSPSQRAIMTDAPHFPSDDQDAYFREYFGLLPSTVGPENLNQTFFFNQRTKLSRPGLEALLSVELFVPTVSPHVSGIDQAVTPGHAGSVFVNNGLADQPPLSIEYRGHESTNRLLGIANDPGPYRYDRIDRLNRKIRLDNAMQMPSHETDALLAAIIGAEWDMANAPDDPPDYWMSENTLRALGLFEMLREDYQCTAEEFAAFMGSVSIYGRGTEPSQFDRVFNKDTLAIPPLVLDDTPFALVPVTEADALTVVHICSGLNIDLATYFSLAPLIAEAHGLETLKRSLPVLSSFYRMARLPQRLGVAPNVAVEILNLSSTGPATLAGQPRIHEDRAQMPDALTEIQRLEGWVRWCADSGLDVAWTVEHVKPIVAPPQPLDAQVELFEQIRAKLAPSLFTEAALRMAGAPELSNGRLWTNQLLELVDRDGLVIHRAESVDTPYEPYAREVVDRVVRQVMGRQDAQTVERITGVLLSSRASQRGVVQERLAVYGQLTPVLALPVLAWSGGTVHDVLLQALGRAPAQDTGGSPRDETPGDPFLGMLAGFTRRSEVVKAFNLSVEFLSLYLSIGDGVSDAPGTAPFTPSTLYYLTVYNRAIALSQKPESQLLGYLQRANELPGNLSGDGLRLVQEQTARLLAELFDWSVEEVRACADRVNAGKGYIRTLEHLDLFTRLRRFALLSQLDAPTTLKIGKLDPDANFRQYEEVAHQVAALLSEPGRTLPLYGIHAMVDRVEVDSSIDTHELVANSDETAELTVTVTRAGAPQANVNVYWNSTLCTVEPAVSITTGQGIATATVRAGTVMGRDVISYRLDAREPQPAATIVLGNDPDTPAFSLLDEDIYVTREKVGIDVTLRARLHDQYDNPIAHEPVSWALDPVSDVAFATSTNAEGVTEVTFTSLTPVILERPNVSVISTGLPSLLFRPISFVLTLEEDPL
ncbi:Tc toxin subunit A [Pseudomonas thivervalensis]|uniref:Tc toxin subunit A n=1 Tax=Pseudomonas thivervalensis TaxID=86265 RepID=UPI00069DC13D|nr:Tc toxin subunit A [Pseudomonas thivervalensis]